MSRSLKHYSWSALNRFGVQLLGFFGNILIARQLTPDDYGLVAMLAIFMGIAWNLTEAGFADCLIRQPDTDPKHFSTIFVYNIALGTFLYLLLYVSAPFIANFFKRQELIDITRIIALTIVIKSLTVTEFTRMRKELIFKSIAIIQLTSSIVSICIAYVMAFNGFDYWAIVFQTLSIAVINLLMIIFINKWKPYFYFSWRRYKEMRVFSLNMMLSYFTNQVGKNLYSLFIGKVHASSILGFYTQGNKINDAAFQGLNAVILTTSYPLLAEQTDRNKRKTMYISILNHFLFIQFIVSFFIIGNAHVLIDFLFGDKWLQTAPYLQLISLSFLFYPLTTLNANIIKIEGKSKLYRNLTFLRNGLNVVALLLTYAYSIEIILLGQIAARYMSVTVDVLICGRIIDFRAIKQIKIVAKQLITPFIAMVVTYYIGTFFYETIINLVICFLCYLGLSIILNLAFKNETQTYYIMMLNNLIKKIRN